MSTMHQDRLNILAILSVESQLVKKLDFKDLGPVSERHKYWMTNL